MKSTIVKGGPNTGLPMTVLFPSGIEVPLLHDSEAEKINRLELSLRILGEYSGPILGFLGADLGLVEPTDRVDERVRSHIYETVLKARPNIGVCALETGVDMAFAGACISQEIPLVGVMRDEWRDDFYVERSEEVQYVREEIGEQCVLLVALRDSLDAMRDVKVYEWISTRADRLHAISDGFSVNWRVANALRAGCAVRVESPAYCRAMQRYKGDWDRDSAGPSLP